MFLDFLPYIPKYNEIAKHRHIMETTRSLLPFADVPSMLWGEAILTIVYLVKHIPSTLLDFLLFHTIHGFPPT